MKTWTLLRSDSALRSPGKRWSCDSARPVIAPVTYQVPRAPVSKLVGFGLAASGPVMPGVLIAVGAAGASLVVDCANPLLAGRKTRARAAVRCFWRDVEETVFITE